jgi:hypothetical protein
MKRKIAAILLSLASVLSITLSTATPANAALAYCSVYIGDPYFLDSSHTYIRGQGGSIDCNGYVASHRALAVIQYITSSGSVASLLYTSSGWKSGGGVYDIWVKTEPKACLNTEYVWYRIQISSSLTDIYDNYSGIQYHPGNWVSKPCGGGVA